MRVPQEEVTCDARIAVTFPPSNSTRMARDRMK
jgi:hypothetical protein